MNVLKRLIDSYLIEYSKKIANLKMIYNPSAIDVWAADNDGVFCIESGKIVYR